MAAAMMDSLARLGDIFSGEGLGVLELERFLLGVSSGLDALDLGSISWAAFLGERFGVDFSGHGFLGERFGVDFSGHGFLGERFEVDFFGLGFSGEGFGFSFFFGEGLLLSMSMGNGEGT